MLFVLLGILDFTFGMAMILTHAGIIHSWRIGIVAAAFWIIKGILFRGSFLSVVDILAGIYFLLVLIGLHTPLAYLFLGMMTYKMIISLVLRG
jgi:hypothetical protein